MYKVYKNVYFYKKLFTKEKPVSIIQITPRKKRILNMMGVINIEPIIDLFVLCLVLLTVLFDLRIHKIPNVILLCLLIINTASLVIFHFFTGNFESSLLKVVTETLVVSFLIFPFFQIGALGAGDVKLITVTALATEEPLLYVLTVFIVAAAISSTKIIKKNLLKQRFPSLLVNLRTLFYHMPISPTDEKAPSVSEKLKYSIHLSAAVFVALLAVKASKYLFVR